MIDLFQIGDSESKFPSRCNMSRLPEEQILGGIVKEHVGVGRDAA
jgi:hypothetical protein